MKAKITNVSLLREVEGKFGKPLFIYNVEYDGKTAQFLSSKKDQNSFVKGQEAEFTETISEYRGEEQIKVKPVQSGSGNFSRALKKEQSRYSGFAMSYAKDLVVADKIDIKDIDIYTKAMFKLMVELDKTLEQ